jgi:hypothetical protein
MHALGAYRVAWYLGPLAVYHSRLGTVPWKLVTTPVCLRQYDAFRRAAAAICSVTCSFCAHAACAALYFGPVQTV